MNRFNTHFVCITKKSEGNSNHTIVSCTKKVRMWDPHLVMAARLGHMDCVRYLVEQLDANIEEIGIVSSCNMYESGASPICAATIGGHLNVVKYLISKGADVNGLTYSNSTPLNVACTHGNLDLVKVLVQNGADIEITDCHGTTCLMLASFNGHAEVLQYLLSVGADLKIRRIDGKGALHVGVHSGSLEVVKVLLDHNAEMNADSCGETPLLTASCLGHDHIVDHFLGRNIISGAEHIEALELLGITFAEKRQDTASAIKYWKLAMHKRCVLGAVIKQEESQTPYYHYFKEVTKPEQLEEFQGNRDAIDTHSLLVKMRILGLIHYTTVEAIRSKGAEFAANGQLKQCIALWMYTLEAHQRILDVLNPKRVFFLISLADLFLNKVLKQPLPSDILLYFEDFINVFENCIQEIKIGISMMDKIARANNFIYHLDRIIPIVMHLMLTLVKLEPILSSVQLRRIYDAVHKLVKLNPRDSKGLSLLHLTCSTAVFCYSDEHSLFAFPSLEVLNILLETGANPCARDCFGNTPLHVLAKLSKIPCDMLEALLAAGAHLDTTNAQGQTFGSLRAYRGQEWKQIVNPVRHTSLQCLAAATIRRHGIPYKGVLHTQLSQFVDFH